MVIHKQSRSSFLISCKLGLNSQICHEEFEDKQFFVALELGFRMVKCVLRKYMLIRLSNVSQFGLVLTSSSLCFPSSGDSTKYKCLFSSRLGVGLVRFKLDYIGPIYLSIYGSAVLVDFGRFFSFLSHTQSVGLLGCRNYTQNKRTQTSMPRVGF
jgi:hypothetical protein